jgi:long-chain acyl-CoA synthetase
MLAHLYDLLRSRAAKYPEAIALGNQEGQGWGTLSSLQLLDKVDALATDLAGKGVQESDRVILWTPNTWRTPIYYFAIWKLGAIIVPLDREVNIEGAVRIVNTVEPKLVITGYGENPSWVPSTQTVEWWEPVTGSSRTDTSGEWRQPAEELAAIFFTSGTTGQPKGCMITHANLCWQVEVLPDNIPIDVTCRVASILPLSHLFELMAGLLFPLSVGAAVHYIPSRRGPDIVRVFQEQHITHMNAVPQLLGLMGNALDNQLRSNMPSYVYNFLYWLAERLPFSFRHHLFWMVHRRLGGHLQFMSSGGAALPEEVKRLWERLGVRIVEGYGTSECSPIVATSSPDGSSPPGSVGKPIRGVTVRLSPDGELMVQGPNVMRGYWKNPERTAEVLQDGWYATGDLANIDPAGNITLLGRARDLIVLPSGMKVWPQDIEDVLREDPVVKDAAVIAVTAGSGAKTLHAYLLAAPGVYKTTVDLDALVARSNEHLAQHQRLASASWWPDADFPRTSILKVRRHLLPPPESAQLVRSELTLPPEDPTGSAIARIARVSYVGRGQTLAELGLDSLAITELALALEENTGKYIAEGDLAAEMTVGEVLEVVAGAPAAGSGAASAQARQGGKPARHVGAWPYTWGQVFRVLAFPFDLLFSLITTRTIVLGGENLADLPSRVIFAGVHHSFADVSLVKRGLSKTPASRFARGLIVPAAADGFAAAGIFASYGILAFGLYPLDRHGAGEASLKQLAELASHGNGVLIFPQGMHARPEQERAGDPSARFRPGVARLARAMDAVVVPFGLAGTEKAIPPYLEEFHGLVIAGIPVNIKRGPLAVAFGPPMAPKSDESENDFVTRLQEASFGLTRRAEKALF